MAVLGVQFVITMMMATVLSRVGPHLSIARWLLCSRWVVASCRLLSPTVNTESVAGLPAWSGIFTPRMTSSGSTLPPPS